MLLALALIGWTAPVEDSVFGCAVLSVPDLDGDGVRDIAVADEVWVRDGRRQWAVWLVSGASHARLAFHHEDHGEGAQNLRLEPIGDVDGDGIDDLVVYEGGGTIHILSGRSLVELHEMKRATGNCGAADVAWVNCRDHGGLALGCPRAGSGEIRLLSHGADRFEPERLLVPSDKSLPGLGSLVHAIPGVDGACDDLLVGSSGDFASISSVRVYSCSSPAVGVNIDLAPYKPTGTVSLVGDLDRDGVREVALGTRALGRRWVNVLSGKTRKTRMIIAGPKRDERFAFGGDDGAFGESICGIDDCDGDGIPDLLIAAPEEHMYDGALYFVSGKTGEMLREVRGNPTDVHLGCALSLADDVDHDGCRDVLVGMGWDGWTRSRSGVYIISGKTGAILGTLVRRDLE